MELVAVGVSSDFRRLWNLDTSKRIDAPAFAPLAMGRHVALEKKRNKLDKLENTRKRGRVKDPQWEVCGRVNEAWRTRA